MDARAKIRSGKKLVKRTCGNDTRMATSGTTQHHAATIQLLLVATVLLGPLRWHDALRSASEAIRVSLPASVPEGRYTTAPKAGAPRPADWHQAKQAR